MAETFEQFNEMLDLESLDKSAAYKRRALPKGTYRTVAPLERTEGTGKNSGVPYVTYSGSALAEDGTTVSLRFTLFPGKNAEGGYDQTFARAAKDIREVTPEIKELGSVLDFIRDYPVDVTLYVKKSGDENGVGAIKAVRA